MTEIEKYSKVFAALGSEQRLAILRLLIVAGDQGLFCGELQTQLSIPWSTLSHHLDKLSAEGLIKKRREKQFIHHYVDTEAIGRTVAFLCARCYRPELMQPLLTQLKDSCGTKKSKGTSKASAETRI